MVLNNVNFRSVNKMFNNHALTILNCFGRRTTNASVKPSTPK